MHILPLYGTLKLLHRYVMAQPLGTILHACQKIGSAINLDIAVVGQGQNGLIKCWRVWVHAE